MNASKSASPDKALLFESIKELRDGYFVEYSPPGPSRPFAMLSLVFTQEISISEIIKCVEFEAQKWIQRFPVPIMTSAFDDKENLVNLTGRYGGSHLVGWPSLTTNPPIFSWNVEDLDAHTRDHRYSQERLQTIYEGVRFRTADEFAEDARKYLAGKRRAAKALRAWLVFWLVLLPTGVAILEYVGPEWIGVIVFVFSLWRAARTWRKINGSADRNEREMSKWRKKQRMEHYFYHCERNPAGFARLLSENVDHDSRQRVRRQQTELSAAVNQENPSASDRSSSTT